MKQIFRDDLWFMQLALEQAELAYREYEVPVGGVLVNDAGQLVASSHNIKEKSHNPISHAEILLLQEAGPKNKNWRLTGHTLYVTLEPCPMCLAAMSQARLKRCVFGAYDLKGGAISLNYNLNQDKRLNHRFEIMGGVKHYECSRLMSQFFRERRNNYSG